MARHGGGCFSGKDPTKVDRSAAYAARWVAKNVVAAGLADRFEIEVAYAIGIAQPLSISIETFGTGRIPDERILGLHRPALRPPPGRDHRGARPAPADLPADRRLRPLRPAGPRPAVGAHRQGRRPRGRGRASRSRSHGGRSPGRRRRPSSRALVPDRRGPLEPRPMYAVILAGGGGTRLWPLSRPERPKPFLPLLGDRSLLRRLRRGSTALAGSGRDGRRGPSATSASSGRSCPDLPAANLIAEPLGRNTAAAIALATVAVDRPDDDVMLVLPADHLVGDEAGSGRSSGRPPRSPRGPIERWSRSASSPRGRRSGTGTSSRADRIVAGLGVFRVDRFVEKPDAVAAADLLAGPGQASWNAGIFAWRRDAIRDALDAWAPEILGRSGTAHVAGGRPRTSRVATVARLDRLRGDGAGAVVGRVVMRRADVGWSDLGGWTALLEALGARAARPASRPMVGSGTRPTSDRRDVRPVPGVSSSRSVCATPSSSRHRTPCLVCAADRSRTCGRSSSG